jgi:hypothetical protein
MIEEPFPSDGSLYDLGLDDGKVYQTEDGFTFHPVGDVSLLQNGCSGGSGSGSGNANGNGSVVRSTTLNVPTTYLIKQCKLRRDISFAALPFLLHCK